MVAETGNIYISETMTDSIEVPTSKSGVYGHVRGKARKSVGV